MRFLLTQLLALIFCQLLSATPRHEIAVIVHPSNSIVKLSRSQLIKIYLHKFTIFPNGQTVKVRDQAPGNTKAIFYRTFFDYSLEELNNYWVREVYQGGRRPASYGDTKDDSEMRNWISRNPNGIGYISRSSLDSSVKEIEID